MEVNLARELSDRVSKNETAISSHIDNCNRERIRSDRAIEKIWQQMNLNKQTHDDSILRLETKSELQIEKINDKLFYLTVGIAGTLITVLIEIGIRFIPL